MCFFKESSHLLHQLFGIFYRCHTIDGEANDCVDEREIVEQKESMACALLLGVPFNEPKNYLYEFDEWLHLFIETMTVKNGRNFEIDRT
jgi:hypothetical protein